MNNYTKTMWVDHLVENPDRYNIIYNPDNSITLSPLEGEVFQEGTPINAIHLNKIEEGVYQSLTGEILLGEFQGESRKLVLKKGTEETMPTLSEGELGYATDTRKLFMGTSAGNASVMPDIDVSGAVEEVIDRRVNTVKNKPLSQILIEEAQAIRDYFVSKITEKINSVTNKPLNQVIKEDTGSLITSRLNSDLTKTLDVLIKEVSKSKGSQIFLENSMFVVPPDVTSIKVSAIAAGENGMRDVSVAPNMSGVGGRGGHRGQYVLNAIFPVTPGETFSIIVGDGNTVIGGLKTLIKGAGGGGGAGGSRVTLPSSEYKGSGGGGGGGAGGLYSTTLPPPDGFPGANGTLSQTFPFLGAIGGDGGGFGSGGGGIAGEIRISSAGGQTHGQNSVYSSALGGYGNIASGGGGAGGGFGAGGGGSSGSYNGGNSSSSTTREGGVGAPGIVIIEW